MGLIRTLEGALGQGAAVTADDITTFGGDQGSTVPWALDDAIDKGDVAAALALLPRLIPYAGSPSDRNGAAFGCSPCSTSATATCCASTVPMFATTSLLRRCSDEGQHVPGEEGDAAESSSRHRKLGRAIDLLADADLSLRGTKDWPPELVVEVLVARLANLSGRR